jgi:hypothetical protein
VGLLGNHVGTLHALLAVGGVAIAGLLLSPVIASPPRGAAVSAEARG